MTANVNTQHESLCIQPDDLLARLNSGAAATIVDVRNPKPWDRSEVKIRGAVRIDPVQLLLDDSWPKDQLLAFY